MKTNFQSFKAIDALRALCRYQTHGGYVWAAITKDGECLCAKCARDNYRAVFQATTHRIRDERWEVIGLTNSGETDADEICANCILPIWRVEQ